LIYVEFLALEVDIITLFRAVESSPEILDRIPRASGCGWRGLRFSGGRCHGARRP